MVDVNDIYEEEDSSFRVHKATREELESMYGKEMVKELLDGKYEDDYCTIEGPDEDGLFVIETEVDGEPNHTFVCDKMLDFMIEHRKMKEKLSKPVPNQCWHCLGSGCNYYVDGGLCSYRVKKEG